MDYKIADLNQKQYNAVKRAEELIKYFLYILY